MMSTQLEMDEFVKSLLLDKCGQISFLYILWSSGHTGWATTSLCLMEGEDIDKYFTNIN